MARDSKKRKKDRKERNKRLKQWREDNPPDTGGGPLAAWAQACKARGETVSTLAFKDARKGSDTKFSLTFDLATPHLVPGMSEGKTVKRASPEPTASEGTSD